MPDINTRGDRIHIDRKGYQNVRRRYIELNRNIFISLNCFNFPGVMYFGIDLETFCFGQKVMDYLTFHFLVSLFKYCR